MTTPAEILKQCGMVLAMNPPFEIAEEYKKLRLSNEEVLERLAGHGYKAHFRGSVLVFE